MFPRLIDIPLGFATLPINSFGLMVLTGFLIGLWSAGRRAKARGIAPELITDLSIWILVGGLIGSRLVYVIFYNHFDKISLRWEYDFSLFNLADGGLHPAGAAAGFLLALAAWVWRRRASAAPAERGDATGKPGGSGSASEPRGSGAAPKPNAPAASPGAATAAAGPEGAGTTAKPRRRAWLGPVAWAVFGGLAGGRAVHVALHPYAYNFKVFAIWEGGIVYYGGLVGALIAGFLFVRPRRIPYFSMADLVAPSVALGEVFGRVGCYLKGCCFGATSNLPWAVSFPKIVETVERGGRTVEEVTGSPVFLHHLHARQLDPGATCSLPVHPVQLYESIAMLALFFILSWYWSRRPRPGRVLAALAAGYGCWRFGAEFLRGDAHPQALHMTFSQVTSLVLVTVAACLWLLAPRGTPPEPIASPAAGVTPAVRP
jgi:phosphatidylglycerol:prolipoprotein diacylglycerol transferase